MDMDLHFLRYHRVFHLFPSWHLGLQTEQTLVLLTDKNPSAFDTLNHFDGLPLAINHISPNIMITNLSRKSYRTLDMKSTKRIFLWGQFIVVGADFLAVSWNIVMKNEWMNERESSDISVQEDGYSWLHNQIIIFPSHSHSILRSGLKLFLQHQTTSPLCFWLRR